MAHRVIEINGHPARSNIKQFACVTTADILNLPREGVEGTLTGVSVEDNAPCGIGSTAIVKTGETYMLWPDNTWAVL